MMLHSCLVRINTFNPSSCAPGVVLYQETFFFSKIIMLCLNLLGINFLASGIQVDEVSWIFILTSSYFTSLPDTWRDTPQWTNHNMLMVNYSNPIINIILCKKIIVFLLKSNNTVICMPSNCNRIHENCTSPKQMKSWHKGRSWEQNPTHNCGVIGNCW